MIFPYRATDSTEHRAQNTELATIITSMVFPSSWPQSHQDLTYLNYRAIGGLISPDRALGSPEPLKLEGRAIPVLDA